MYNIYTHGSNAVENNFSCKASILNEEALFFKDRNVFYIGDNLLTLFPDRLRIDRFLYQKISGKFHISSQKEYVVDIRVMQDNLFRVLLFCDFERFLVISKPTAMKNCDLILYSLLEKSFKITQEFRSNNFTVFLFVKKFSDNIIGKRATLKNSIVEELWTLYNITQNDARRILDEWNIEEISNAPIYFMPTYIISNINIFITSLKKH